MKKLLAPVILSVFFASGEMMAQDKPAATPQVVGLKVQVVISRYQGEKRISSVPYTMSVTASNQRSAGRVRIGAQVPVPGVAPPTTADGKPNPAATSFTYQNIGTNIDCVTNLVGDRLYQLDITIEQSSVMSEDQPKPSGTTAPVLRSFRLTNSAVLKDGQTMQFATATDAVTGEVVRIDVTVNVMS